MLSLPILTSTKSTGSPPFWGLQVPTISVQPWSHRSCYIHLLAIGSDLVQQEPGLSRSDLGSRKPQAFRAGKKTKGIASSGQTSTTSEFQTQ